MTADTAIKRFDALFPNALPYEEKLNMLSELDGRIYTDVLSRYEDAPVSFSEYTPETSEETELLVKFPYNRIYIKYLAAETDLLNGDTVRYYNSHTVFNTLYNEFTAYVNRTHCLKTAAKVKSGGDIL